METTKEIKITDVFIETNSYNISSRIVELEIDYICKISRLINSNKCCN